MSQLGLTVSIPSAAAWDAPAHASGTDVDGSATAIFYVLKLQKWCDHSQAAEGSNGGDSASVRSSEDDMVLAANEDPPVALPEVVEYTVRVRYSQVFALHRKHFASHPVTKKIVFPPRWTLADVCWSRSAKIEFRRRTFETYFRTLLR